MALTLNLFKQKPSNKIEMSENYQKILQAKEAELAEVKEELKKAIDSVKKSWLASKHLKDELVASKSTLENARDQTCLSNVVISDFELQLEEMNMNIKSKMEEELKAKEMTDEITEILNRTQKEIEVIKWEKRVEQSETAYALITKTETSSVHRLTEEEYYALITKAREETTLAKWRISLSMKQKLAAEINRNLALSRLGELWQKKRKGRGKEIKLEDDIIGDAEEQEFQARVGSQFNGGTTTLKAEDRPNQTAQKQNRRQRKLKQHNKEASKRKKQSILIQVRSFFFSSFSRFFHS